VDLAQVDVEVFVKAIVIITAGFAEQNIERKKHQEELVERLPQRASGSSVRIRWDFLDAQTVFNNDYDNSTGQGIGRDLGYVETSECKLIDCRRVQERYIRCYSRGNHVDGKNRYTEVRGLRQAGRMKGARAFAAWLTLVLAAAAGLRLAHLDNRAMHCDEAVLPIRFGQLLERGAYTYDPHA
jgi:hypothetical protein